MKILFIIPAYNEEKSILRTAESVIEAGYDYIVVNDGSTDKTLDVCLENDLNVLNLIENLGIGGAVQAGHKYAWQKGYDVDIQFDGDGQHDITCAPVLIEQIRQGADLAIGSRFLQQTEGFQSTALRRAGIAWLSFLIKLFGKERITDPTSGFRACNRVAIKLFCDNYPTDYPEPESIALALKQGFTVREASVTMKERQGGTSSIKPLSSIYYMIKVSLAIIIAGFSNTRGEQ